MRCVAHVTSRARLLPGTNDGPMYIWVEAYCSHSEGLKPSKSGSCRMSGCALVAVLTRDDVPKGSLPVFRSRRSAETPWCKTPSTVSRGGVCIPRCGLCSALDASCGAMQRAM